MSPVMLIAIILAIAIVGALIYMATRPAQSAMMVTAGGGQAAAPSGQSEAASITHDVSTGIGSVVSSIADAVRGH